MEMGVIVVLIVCIIILVLLMLYIGKITESFKINTEVSRCKTSIYAFAKLHARGSTIKQQTISCPVHKLVVSKEEDILPMVAKEMAVLWDNFGEGKLDLFSPEDEVFCVLGSHITFSGIKKEMHGLLPYLNEHAYKQTSYLEYLTGIPSSTVTKSQLLSPQLQPLDKIDTSHPLGILFVYNKDTKMTKQEGVVYGLGIGTVVGAVAGIATLFYFPPGGISLLGITIISPLLIGTAQVASVTAISSIALATTGYLFGHDESAEWDARILSIPFTPKEISRLPCTYWPVPLT